MDSTPAGVPFCALGYRREDGSDSALAAIPVILLVLPNRDGGLRFLAHPELRKMFKGRDLDYLDSLLWDFVARSKSAPNELFRQVSSLGGVGPLVTHSAGTDISEFPALVEMCKRFIEL